MAPESPEAKPGCEGRQSADVGELVGLFVPNPSDGRDPKLPTPTHLFESRVPQIWRDDRYDLVWVLGKTGQGDEIELGEVPQMLLAGDRSTPIGTAGPG